MTNSLRLLTDRTDLREEDRDHLRALVGEWTLLSDLSFADLVLWVPTWNNAGFAAVAHVRPTTAPTELPHDVVGQFVSHGRRSLLDRAFASGRLIRSSGDDGSESSAAIPVRVAGRVVGVVARHPSRRATRAGTLEETYARCARDLERMVADGEFPMPDWLGSAEPTRVGDGLIRLDKAGIVEFASPNASSAFHRLGLAANLHGGDLSQTARKLVRTPGPVDESLLLVASGVAPGVAQLENRRAVVSLRAIPLREGGRRIGALVLVRDVTDLRQRERALLTKDSTIREIHHRVKNNLQTVSALLRMQSRRVADPGSREVLADAVRRVEAIAVVHDSLSGRDENDADFDEIADRVVMLTRDLAVHATVERVGSVGSLPAKFVFPLAMVSAELLANAAQHGASLAAGSRPIQVVLRLTRTGRRVCVEVSDDGAGLPAGFDPAASMGLGIQIVKTLVADELAGSVVWESPTDGGTKVIVDFLVTD